MTTEYLILSMLLLPVGGSVACLLLRGRLEFQRAITLGVGLALAGASAGLVAASGDGSIAVVSVGGWEAPFGIVLVADVLSSVMLFAASGVGALVLFYAGRQLPSAVESGVFYPVALFMILGVNGSLLTGDLFNLYVWFEVMLLASFVLLALGGEKAQLEGALKYVVINLVASILFLSAAGILYGKVGTLNLADIAVKLGSEPDPFVVNSTAVLLLGAFGIKAALFPFFFWLPASYHTPPVAVTALFAGLLTKVGIYAILRVFPLLFEPEGAFLHPILVGIAGFTMVVGVLGAAAHFEIKRILSFHIVSQIGYMLMGFTFATPLAYAGVLFFLVHNMVAKTALFLIGGMVEIRCGSSDLAKTGGLFRKEGWMALTFLLAAFALAGLPPLSGFFAKLILVQAGFEVGAWWLVGVSLGVGVMTLFSMTKIWAEAFWKEMPEAAEAPPRVVLGPRLWIPSATLAIVAVLMGVFCQSILELFLVAGEQLVDPSAYFEAVLGKGGVR